MVEHQAQISAFRDLCYEMCLKINTLLGIGLEVSQHASCAYQHVLP